MKYKDKETIILGFIVAPFPTFCLKPSSLVYRTQIRLIVYD